MATNPIGPDTENIPLNLPKWLLPKVDFLAARAKVSRNAYITGVLIDAAKSGKLVRKSLESYDDPEALKALTEFEANARRTAANIGQVVKIMGSAKAKPAHS